VCGYASFFTGKKQVSCPRESVSLKRTFECALLALLGCYFLGHTLPRAWRTLNTDFPNYYLASRLVREGVDPSRAYEWIWLQREKDHRAIDQRIVGLVPITPFSTLAMWPIAGLPPLTAKHAWLLFNLALLIPISWLMRSVTGLSLIQVGCLIGLCFPLHRNFLYGQYYVVLLGILTVACWAVQRQRNYLAGSLLAVAVAVKVFPVILALHFVRKKNWAALLACLFTGMLCAAASIAVFGWSLHRTYLLQVLPWTLRGEVLDPYNLVSSSLSTLLHRLFVFEPQLNPHPALHAAWLFAVLHPALQLALLLPALVWIEGRASSATRTSLEWSVLLLATLTLTPLPASYHLTVLLLPVAVICGYLLQQRRTMLLMIVIALFLAAGYPVWNTAPVDGWKALGHVKRLYALALLAAAALSLIKKNTRIEGRNWWIAGGALALIVSIFSGLKHQHALYDDYRYRLPISREAYSVSQPVPQGSQIQTIALLPSGYRRAIINSQGMQTQFGDPATDDLSLTVGPNQLWTEVVGVHSILQASAGEAVLDGESPATVAGGAELAFLRQIDGRKQLFAANQQLTATTSGWNVEEIAPSPNNLMIVSATRLMGRPGLYQVKAFDHLEPIPVGEARYPALSPDGRWLAFSSFQSGYWNLSLRDLSTGEQHRLTTVACNQTQPAWLPDSKTLLYSSDCGRALGFTVICKRRFLP
jgi:Glycosyltransferase family 87/WD40-like Beta Propeller Repeat